MAKPLCHHAMFALPLETLNCLKSILRSSNGVLAAMMSVSSIRIIAEINNSAHFLLLPGSHQAKSGIAALGVSTQRYVDRNRIFRNSLAAPLFPPFIDPQFLTPFSALFLGVGFSSQLTCNTHFTRFVAADYVPLCTFTQQRTNRRVRHPCRIALNVGQPSNIW